MSRCTVFDETASLRESEEVLGRRPSLISWWIVWRRLQRGRSLKAPARPMGRFYWRHASVGLVGVEGTLGKRRVFGARFPVPGSRKGPNRAPNTEYRALSHFTRGRSSLAVAASFPLGSSSRYFWRCSRAAAF